MVLALAAILAMFSPNATGQTAAYTPPSSGIPLEVTTVWYSTAAPPAATGDTEKKPAWKNGSEDINPSQNIWYPLKDRTGPVKIGGDGDHYIGLMRFEVPTKEVETLKKASVIKLQIFVDKYSKNDPIPEEIEVRAITSTSPLPNKDGKIEPVWTPEVIRPSNPPSSRPLTVFKVKEGVNLIDVTETVKKWLNGETKNQGLMFFPLQTNGKYCVIRSSGKESPALMYSHPPEK